MKRTSEQFYKWFHKERWNHVGNMSEWERDARGEWFQEMEVGDHAHVCFYSDVKPCTIIRKTASTITVRYDKATLKDTWKPEFIPGGFGVHCTNNDDQHDAWNIEEDPDGYTEVFRWSKKSKRYKGRGDNLLSPEWMMFYDYNF